MSPAGSGRLLRPRMERLRASHSFGSVLALIVITFGFTALAPDTDWAGSILLLLECGTLIVALYTSGVARSNSRLSIMLVTVSIASAVALIIWEKNWLAGAVALLSAALVFSIGTAIIVGVIDQGEVNRQAVTGAVCIYLLIGFFFIFLYGTVAEFGRGALFAQGTDGTRAIRLYFSYVTLATVGYGDYTMAGNFGRMLSVIEALMGQLYLVIVLALLVSRMRPKRAIGS
jgi:Ion channel